VLAARAPHGQNARMPTWDDAQYLMFADERMRPARELLARVPLGDARRVVDLGCGPGNSTALLLARWPGATLTGVDSSEEMLRRARQDLPGVEWVQADAARFVAEQPLDVLFANALLQWLPDHDVLLPALFEQLTPGGVLAVQMPRNLAEPSHRLMREASGAWAERLGRLSTRAPVQSPAFYYDLLAPQASSVDIWQTTYEHVMADAPAIVEWVKGTGLRPYLEALSDAERPVYLDAYTRAIHAAYPARSDGRRLFSFPRLFIVATRARG
jgi:trans-aconitate 2-methyltransferase